MKPITKSDILQALVKETLSDFMQDGDITAQELIKEIEKAGKTITIYRARGLLEAKVRAGEYTTRLVTHHGTRVRVWRPK